MKYLYAILVLTLSFTTHAEIKRTPSGHPDLSGFYDTGTLTPLDRPEEFGTHKFIDQEQAQKIAAAQLSELSSGLNDSASDPDRGAPKKGGDGKNRVGEGGVGGYNAFWIDPGSSAFEIDGKYRTSIIYQPNNGRRPAPTQAAMAKLAARSSSFTHENDGTASWMAYDGPGPFDDPERLAPSERCLISFGSTVPTIPSLYNNYKRIVQTDDHIMILQEMVHDARIIRLDSEHGPVVNQKWMGDSIGHWEGDTLVVHTRNFRAVSGLAGADENLQVTERFKLREDGHLIYDFTVNDDTAWSEPWSGEYVWTASKDKVYEYACHEGNYGMVGILRGARVLEADWIAEHPTD